MLSHRFDDALGFAAETHRGQTRKGCSVPYISHLMAVSALTFEHGGDEDCAIAALLHDAVEDQGGPEMAQAIGARFGKRILGIVLECSDSSGEPKAPWRQRKESYIAALPTKSAEAILVTGCDKLHNASAILHDLRAIGPKVFDRFNANRDEVLWYYRALADGIAARRGDALSARLSQTVQQLVATATAKSGA